MDDEVFQCECGISYHLDCAEVSAGCLACGEDLSELVKAHLLSTTTGTVKKISPGGIFCTICEGEIKSGLEYLECGCGQMYHSTCFDREGGCPECREPAETVEASDAEFIIEDEQEPVVTCAVCSGLVKTAADLYHCPCGTSYHESCITRTKLCSKCERPFATDSLDKDMGGANGHDEKWTRYTIAEGKTAKCMVCRGFIKGGTEAIECHCGKQYHPTCIDRVKKCPNCDTQYL